MRYHEIVSAPLLLEGREGHLYHAMNGRKTLRVLATDTMEAQWKHELPTNPGKLVTGISFTRDGKLRWANLPVLLTVDQRILAQTHRIIPVDGHYVHQYTRQRLDWENVRSRTRAGLSPSSTDPSEEFVVGDVKALHRYVVEIAIVGTTQDLGDLVHVARAYGEKWNIPLRLAPEVTAEFDRWVAEGGSAHPQIVQYFPDYRPVEPPAPEKPARRRRAKAA